MMQRRMCWHDCRACGNASSPDPRIPPSQQESPHGETGGNTDALSRERAPRRAVSGYPQSTSSERREYVPIGWLEPPTIPSNLVIVLPGKRHPRRIRPADLRHAHGLAAPCRRTDEKRLHATPSASSTTPSQRRRKVPTCRSWNRSRKPCSTPAPPIRAQLSPNSTTLTSCPPTCAGHTKPSTEPLTGSTVPAASPRNASASSIYSCSTKRSGHLWRRRGK